MRHAQRARVDADSTPPAGQDSGLNIRPLFYRDLRAVVRIERETFGTPWSWREFAFELSRRSSICLAAVDSEGLAGYLVCSRQDHLRHVRNLAVHPARRRSGIGSALLHALLERAERPEDEYVLDVRASAHAPIALYERFGFRPAGRRPAFYGDNQEDAVIMWLSRPLTPGTRRDEARPLRLGDMDRASAAGASRHEPMTRSSKPLRPADGTPPSADELACERVQDPADVAEDWDALALASGNIFATREFLELWRHHVVTDRELLIIVCREMPAGRAVGILPLYRWGRFPLSVVRFLGHGAGDELGPICAPPDIPRVVQALQRALIDEAPHLFLGERMRPAPLGILSGARTITSEGYPIVSLAHADWDAYLASRSSNFRQQLRRRERRLEQHHELRYRAVSPCDFELCFDLLVSLHRARWGPRTSFLASVDFHRDFARLALEHGWLRLWFMELEGTPVAAWYGFQFSGVMSYYQAGRDPAWEHASVGLLLLAHTIREALSEGLGEYRLLRGGEGYKYRFTDDDPGLETLVVARGLFAAGAVRTLELTRLLRRQLRAPRASHRRPADGRPT